jgi:hypothetical protein
LTWQARLIEARALDRIGDDVHASAQRELAAREFAVLVDRVDDLARRTALEESWDRRI